ncbi:MAG: hypothetical protein CVU51_07835 [Deltaproteobacteria bacterium HGW-Deltaproteobacteria-1]|nr:MAG: hypothetical protein CVU51_07835 [Deltaproteobacteria bacterium HGW-Deltaproteobacteria-1]
MSSVAFATGPLKDRDREDSLLGFITGSYEVIGKRPDGGGTYQGTMTLVRKGRELVITRTIEGRKITGTAKIIAATSDEIPVLQADFTERNQKHRIIYMIGSDLDNFARLTGKVFFPDRETKIPGLEALFIQDVSD